MLRLDGPSGSLDIVTVYMPTGQAAQERAAVRDQIVAHIRPESRALMVMIGDWNFVRETRDRLHFDAESWTRGRTSKNTTTSRRPSSSHAGSSRSGSRSPLTALGKELRGWTGHT